MKLKELKLKTNHFAAFRPKECDTMTVTQAFYDEEHKRICLQVKYDNGYIDFIPLSSVLDGDYEVSK